MSDNVILLVAAVAGFLLLQKKKAAAAASTAPLPTANNVNNQLWSSVLGNSWRSLVQPGSASNFLERNNWGQIVTSDGKPVDSVFGALPDILSGGVDTTEASDGIDYLSELGW
jgi:hypothetical protein